MCQNTSVCLLIAEECQEIWRWVILRSMDLYTQLEELQGMTRLLINDLTLLKAKIGEGNPDPTNEEKANRRFYVRAVFALVEAFVEQHRRLLVMLSEQGKVTLPENRVRKLREIKQILGDNGTV